MRRFSIFLSVGVVSLALASQAGDNLLSRLQQALTAAESLKAVYEIQPLSGASARYTVVLQKPNKARVDGPAQVVVADGSTITTYDKATKQYSRRPQTDAELKSMFRPEETNAWAGFFDTNAYQPYRTKAVAGTQSDGTALEAIEALYDQHGRRSVTYYLNPADNVLRQARIDIADANGKNTSILSTTEVVLNGVPSDAFAFKPPPDAKEVRWEDMSAVTWLTNLEEAKKLAQKTGKKIFVDFMAEWCGPCKDLERDVFKKPEFRKYASKVVLLKIDVDKQQAVSQAYGIEAMPTQMVLDPYGKVVASTVGYGGPQAFYRFLDGALSR
ncbi:MAG TPA: thioredoxin family protein [Fimbriimonas sp.]